MTKCKTFTGSAVKGLSIAMFSGLEMLDGAPCTLPSSWEGDWYESDVGRVTITTNGVSTKGTCVDADHNFYLLRNRLISIQFEHCNLVSTVQIPQLSELYRCLV